MIDYKSFMFYLLQGSGRGSEVIGSVGEGTELGLQRAALSVVGVKPAGTSFQGAVSDGLPLGVRPERFPVPPVPDAHPPPFHWERRDDRKCQELFRIKCIFSQWIFSINHYRLFIKIDLKVKPDSLDRHLVAGCCTGHKPCHLHVSGWDMDQYKKPQKHKLYFSSKFGLESVSTGSDVKKCGVGLPLKTWWLFLSSVWRPPHSFFRSCRVSCSSSPATSLTERLPEEDQEGKGGESEVWQKKQFKLLKQAARATSAWVTVVTPVLGR